MNPQDSDAEEVLELDALIRAATARLTTDRNAAVCELREFEESRACRVLGIRPPVDRLVASIRERVVARLDARTALKACSYLRNAEVWQWEKGSWSTGAGDGLMSMWHVYALKLSQAWLYACMGDVSRAQALTAEIAAAPNRFGARFEAEIASLHDWLDGKPPSQ